MTQAKFTPGPWSVQFCMPLTRYAGLYVSRMRPDRAATNSREWLLNDGKPARFTSREAANAAIAKASRSVA